MDDWLNESNIIGWEGPRNLIFTLKYFIQLQGGSWESIPGLLLRNKPENQDEDALGKIEQQQDFVILEQRDSLKVGVHF